MSKTTGDKMLALIILMIFISILSAAKVLGISVITDNSVFIIIGLTVIYLALNYSRRDGKRIKKELWWF